VILQETSLENQVDQRKRETAKKEVITQPHQTMERGLGYNWGVVINKMIPKKSTS
jgi:hypothetical protein